MVEIWRHTYIHTDRQRERGWEKQPGLTDDKGEKGGWGRVNDLSLPSITQRRSGCYVFLVAFTEPSISLHLSYSSFTFWIEVVVGPEGQRRDDARTHMHTLIQADVEYKIDTPTDTYIMGCPLVYCIELKDLPTSLYRTRIGLLVMGGPGRHCGSPIALLRVWFLDFVVQAELMTRKGGRVMA